jgi:hypothetical protein
MRWSTGGPSLVGVPCFNSKIRESREAHRYVTDSASGSHTWKRVSPGTELT